jgi:hypothetical protein
MKISLKAAKVKGHPAPYSIHLDEHWAGKVLNQDRETGGFEKIAALRKISLSTASPACSTAGFRYNPFTAADEKITLSVVHVNSKPQYLVFSLHSGTLVDK